MLCDCTPLRNVYQVMCAVAPPSICVHVAQIVSGPWPMAVPLLATCCANRNLACNYISCTRHATLRGGVLPSSSGCHRCSAFLHQQVGLARAARRRKPSRGRSGRPAARHRQCCARSCWCSACNTLRHRSLPPERRSRLCMIAAHMCTACPSPQHFESWSATHAGH